MEQPKSLLQQLQAGAPTIFVLAVIGLAWLSIHSILNNHSESEIETEDAAAVAAVAEVDTIQLPPGKMAAANIQCELTEVRPLQPVHTVPARLRYDATRHVEVKSPLEGILEQVLVSPGDEVKVGQVLAILRSPEIGQARATIRQRLQVAELATTVLKREQSVLENLNRLLQMLDQRESDDKIQQAFAEQSLGGYRQQILAAHAQRQLAKSLLDKLEPLAGSGAVAGRTIREHEAELQLAETAYATSRDEARFQAQQSVAEAQAKFDEAQRQVELARQSLELLLGYHDEGDMAIDDQGQLSRLEIKAPISGSVESRELTNNERVQQGQSLMILADTGSLYVEANLRESDWTAIQLEAGTPVQVEVPALNNRRIPATVVYAGREVKADTNAVPLVAAIDNPEGLLRPGMFVNVTIPMGQPLQSLCVRPQSVMQHENQSFVFVKLGEQAFQRVGVTLGKSSEDCIEVTDGLKPGQEVVVEGAFLLKSELLLQGESE